MSADAFQANGYEANGYEAENDKNIADEETIEKKHFQRIVHAFRFYRIHSLRRLFKSSKYISNLPQHHQQLLKNYRAHLDKVRVCIEHNFEIIKVILKDVAHMFENADHSQDVKISHIQAFSSDMEKVQSVFKQLFREWSEEGRAERDACYEPILMEILLRYPKDEVDRHNIKVLVPGAGLGRLAYEIAKRGFMCQGNEFSLFMLFVSNHVLNKCQGVNLYQIYPWVHQYYNHLNTEDQLHSVRFPDADPSDLPPNSEFSMAAGNFTEIYTTPDYWDCIATCFFIDTANNIVSYIETIWNVLKPGGYWINMGPLLYHFSDIPNEESIEPSYEEIRTIMKSFGFHLLKEETGIRTPYTQNPLSMMYYEYRSVFFVCQKPES